MKRGFGSDNHSGICPEVLKAISDANVDCKDRKKSKE